MIVRKDPIWSYGAWSHRPSVYQSSLEEYRVEKGFSPSKTLTSPIHLHNLSATLRNID